MKRFVVYLFVTILFVASSINVYAAEYDDSDGILMNKYDDSTGMVSQVFFRILMKEQ